MCHICVFPVDACQQRQCPRFKVCTINIQGLPICTCPSKLVCDGNKRRNQNNNNNDGDDALICGSDHVTYKSRCHMRVANCEKGRRIRRKHSGPCLIDPNTATSDVKIITSVSETDSGLSEDEEKLRLKTLAKAKRRRLRKKKKMKEKRRRKKERKMRKNRDKRRRMKRRNHGGYNPYTNRYDKLIGRYTKWGRSQVRKSRI